MALPRMRTAVAGMKRATRIKRIFETLAVLFFLFLLGSVGAVEVDKLSLGRGIVQMAAGLVGMWVFTGLAGEIEEEGGEDNDR